MSRKNLWPSRSAGSLGGFDQLILPTAQWCLFGILMGAWGA